ncbi:TPA: aminoacyl-histidine dipeptidase [Clostridioides difficile]|uniref:aminoacyl-histidine dipeptidase n=1 Tax=Clostridioides difficile TaxID=1496 RepID=UPI00372F15A3
MGNVLEGLKPESVFKNFEKISQIPRGSGNEKGISDFLLSFGKNLGLETIQDESLNIIIRKPATKGYENCPGVVLQGHMDMVCEKEKNVEHDFLKDPIKLRIDGDMIYATGTTLGADNGIAVAMGMAILEDNTLEHPALEVLVTVNEEDGMNGADALDPSLIKGQYILNMDSEEEGYLLVSCAGGKTCVVSLPVEYKEVKGDKQGLLVEVTGLLGGHSGMEIVLQRANANKAIARVLSVLDVDYELASVDGGTKHNAIPREAKCVIAVNKADVESAKKQINDILTAFKHEFTTSDPGMTYSVAETSVDKVLTKDCKEKVVQMSCLTPHGVQSVSLDIEGLVESSTNFAIIETKESTIEFLTSVRSSVMSIRDEIADRIRLLAQALGANYDLIAQYPAWEFKKGSKLEKICSETYEKLTGKVPTVMALHAGLECGLLLDKLPHAEAISIGPDMFDVHTPNEHVSIPSVANVWDYVIEILKSMNQY